MTLEEHTDATGPEDYNLRLSQRRAEAVVAHLVGRGVAAPRLRAAGFGETRLLPAFAPADDRQRRGGDRSHVLTAGACRRCFAGRRAT